MRFAVVGVLNTIVHYLVFLPLWFVLPYLAAHLVAISSATAIGMWMRSPEHRANILNPNWREIGIAAVHSDGAPGTFDGKPVTIITTDFGVRGD